jgi:hypothetical protein
LVSRNTAAPTLHTGAPPARPALLLLVFPHAGAEALLGVLGAVPTRPEGRSARALREALALGAPVLAPVRHRPGLGAKLGGTRLLLARDPRQVLVAEFLTGEARRRSGKARPASARFGRFLETRGRSMLDSLHALAAWTTEQGTVVVRVEELTSSAAPSARMATLAALTRAWPGADAEALAAALDAAPPLVPPAPPFAWSPRARRWFETAGGSALVEALGYAIANRRQEPARRAVQPPLDDEFVSFFRDALRMPDPPGIECVEPAFVLPSSFRVARGSPLPDPQLEAARCALGLSALPHTVLFDAAVHNAKGACVLPSAHYGSRRRGFPAPWRALPGKARGLKGTWLFGGAFIDHIGHFTLECLGRLWAWAETDRPMDGVLWTVIARGGPAGVLPAPFPPRSVPGQMMALLGIDVPHLIVHEPVRVERLLVPDQLMGLDRGARLAPHPRLRAFLRARLADAEARPGDGPPVFVSRAGLDPVRQVSFVGEAALEDSFRAVGWQVMRPETLSLAEQFHVYARAPKLVFSEGSAVHLFALVADVRQEVLILNRRSPPSRQLRAQLLGLGLARVEEVDALATRRPRSGREARDPTAAPRLDFSRLGATLSKRGFVAAADWRPPSEADVEADAARRRALAAQPQTHPA